MSIAENIGFYKEQMRNETRLVAVSKMCPASFIMEAYNAGQRIFGESKAQEISEKYKELPKDIEWHFIGHLQTNKVKYIAPFVTLIHSVDSLKLLEEINRQAQKYDRVIACLLEIHIASEESKFGLDRQQASELIDHFLASGMRHVELHGLMGMASFTEDQERIRNEFKYLCETKDYLAKKYPTLLKFKELSMGMSGDYKIAMEEGSTLVRVGTAIFGERNYTV